MPTVLDMALLSMDVYEQGDQGLNPGGDVGLFARSGAPSVGGVSGFFAQSYSFSGGTVIAYRGTYGINDVLTGWAGGFIGSTTLAPQYGYAAEFYQQVNGNSIASNSNIYLTGHSLGGGLAGFAGALYGESATIFDNINFMGAAQNAWETSRTVELAPGLDGPTSFGIRQIFYRGAEPPAQAPFDAAATLKANGGRWAIAGGSFAA